MAKKRKSKPILYNADEAVGQPLAGAGANAEEQRAEVGPQPISLRPMGSSDLRDFDLGPDAPPEAKTRLYAGYFTECGGIDGRVAIGSTISGIGQHGKWQRERSSGGFQMSGRINEIFMELFDRVYGKGQWRTDRPEFQRGGKGFVVLGKAPRMVLDGRGGSG